MLLAAMHDAVHRGTALAEGVRSRAGHGRRRLPLVGLAPPRSSRKLTLRLPSKCLTRSVALVGEEAPVAGTRATMKRDAGTGCRGGLLGQPLPPQLLQAGTDCLEIVSGSWP